MVKHSGTRPTTTGVFEKFSHRIAGVVDLLGGEAVHAVAGLRSRYKPVPFCDGDPLALAHHYAQLGITTLYVADLDAIAGKTASSALLGELSLHFCDQVIAQPTHQDQPQTVKVIMDLGWRGDPTDERGQLSLVNDLKSKIGERVMLQWIAATECMKSTASLAQLVEQVGSEKVILSLDFRDGQLLGNHPQIETWNEKLVDLNIASVIVLDVASVGTANGGTTFQVCQRLKEQTPGITLYSGGGLRFPADLEHLFQNGCDVALLATALYPHDPQ